MARCWLGGDMFLDGFGAREHWRAGRRGVESGGLQH